MKISFNTNFFRLFLFTGSFLCSFTCFGQGGPPGHNPTLSVTSTGSLNFGKFSKNNGGSITLNLDGYIYSTGGDIFILNSPPSPVVFYISTNRASNSQIIVTASTTPLTGPGSLGLSVDFDRTFFSIDKNNPAIIKMGGTLTVGPDDLPGIYTGSVFVNFAYQ